ncbi:putative ascorbate ferrireductase (transmembrane) [Helianthus annuus]|nr:putative ascorbate ferrireductase (transmembrane) [Helianthus annuus]
MITVWLSIFCHLDRYLFHVQLNQVLHKWRRYVWYKLYITSVYLKKVKFYKFWGFYAAILVHRWLPGSRKKKKWVHLWLQGVALVTGIFGIRTKFQGTQGVVANFYSLHSWMGLLCVSLFGAQKACSYNCSCHYASRSRSRSSVGCSTERYMSITSQVNLHSSDRVFKHHHYCCHLRS